MDDWSRDGRYIILGTFGDPKTKADVWVLPTFGDRKPFPYLQTEFSERRVLEGGSPTGLLRISSWPVPLAAF